MKTALAFLLLLLLSVACSEALRKPEPPCMPNVRYEESGGYVRIPAEDFRELLNFRCAYWAYREDLKKLGK